MSDQEKRMERIRKEYREQYFKEHGEYPKRKTIQERWKEEEKMYKQIQIERYGRELSKEETEKRINDRLKELGIKD